MMDIHMNEDDIRKYYKEQWWGKDADANRVIKDRKQSLMKLCQVLDVDKIELDWGPGLETIYITNKGKTVRIVPESCDGCWLSVKTIKE